MNFWNSFEITPSIEKDIKFCEEINEDDLVCLNLTGQQQEQLKHTIDMFPISTPEYLGRTHLLAHSIDTGDENPVNRRPYVYSPAIEKQLFEEIDRLLKFDIIRKSNSNWANPIVCVDKKSSGKIRACLDARFLNKLTKKDKYPLANINRIFGRLQKSQVFSSVDLKDAFHQIPLEESSKEKTAFIVTGRGLFEYQVTPFGLCNSAQTQQRLMDKVLGFEHDGKIFCYLDDIVVCSETFEEHFELLEFVAKKLTEAGLIINLEKSKFCRSSIKYLGFIIDKDGLHIDPDKIEPILNYLIKS
jgi:hypothetical protein